MISSSLTISNTLVQSDRVQPLVGIVIVHYGSPEKTRRCLNACLAQLHSAYFIVVVDNASPDGSGRELRDEFDSERLLFILNPQNEGYSVGNNLGISLSLSMGAQAIWLLNSDARPEPSALSALVQAIKHYPYGGAFGSKIYYDLPDSPPVIWSAGGTIDYQRRVVGMRGLHEKDTGQFQSVEKVDYLPGCSLFVPASVTESVGLLDEKFFLYFEDTDWCARIREKGQQLYFVPESVVWHDSQDEKLDQPWLVYYYNRNAFEFWYRHGRAKISVIAEAAKALGRALRAAWYAPSWEGRGVFYAHALASAHFIARSFGRQSWWVERLKLSHRTRD